MKNVLRKSNIAVCILILIVVCLGIVFASDVIVKEGTLEAEENIQGERFKSTGCTATGLQSVAFGYYTNATGVYSTAMGAGTTAGADYSTAMGYLTTAGGDYSTAMGCMTEATGIGSTAIGYDTTSDAVYSTAMGYSTTASGDYSTAMGYYTTANGTKSTAMGDSSIASGGSSTAMGQITQASGASSTAMGTLTIASGIVSTAMGFQTGASGDFSTAMGAHTIAGPATYTTAIGKAFTNDYQDSFAVGFGQKDFSVESELVTVHKNLHVTYDVDANTYSEHSAFYDKDTYGAALDYTEDSSKTIKVNADGETEYDHEADPVFLQKWVTVKDYDKYTEEDVWNEALEQNITRRTYQTHQELRSNLSMKVAWLRQCVYELKQENQTLKDEIAQLKVAVGIK